MNTSIQIHDYAGNQLSDDSKNLLNMIELHGFSAKTSGPAKKTIQICKGTKQFAYINDHVTSKGGILGYHFALEGRNSCPNSFSSIVFAKKYRCEPVNLYTLNNNKGSYLLILDLATALQVLLYDAYI